MANFLDIHPNAKENINEIANELLSQVQSLDFKKYDETVTKTDRPAPTTITDQDILGQPILRGQTTDGNYGIAFLYDSHKVFGLSGGSVQRLDDLISRLIKIPAISNSVSDLYLEDAAFEWLRKCRTEGEGQEFWLFLVSKLKADVREYCVLVPVDGITTECEIMSGNVAIKEFKKEYFDKWEEILTKDTSSGHRDKVKEVISEMRQDMQGYAVIEVRVQAETEYANSAAYYVANRLCDLLRVFSPYRRSLSNRCWYGLLGSTIVPRSKSLVLDDKDSFWYKQSVIGGVPGRWHINEEYKNNMLASGFGSVFKLAVTGAKCDYEEYVWRSIVAFSKSLTPVALEDRIAFRVAAIESMLLKDSTEPIAASVGDRLAFILGKDQNTRREIVRNFKNVYSIRSDYVHHRKTRNEEVELEIFAENAWLTLQILIINLGTFKTKADFLEEVENRRYGS